MNPELDTFIAELRADPRMADLASPIEDALCAVVLEGDENGDALELGDAIVWIARQRSRSLFEKLTAMRKLFAHETEGRTTVHLREFLGWK